MDPLVEANACGSLRHDISKVLSKGEVNVTAVKTQSKGGIARMALTVEMANAETLKRVLAVVSEVTGVASVRRG